jgi:hypothetical protein
MGFEKGDETPPDADFDEMAKACITNHDAVMRHGSPEMQLASKLLLFSLGEELVRRDQVKQPANDV